MSSPHETLFSLELVIDHVRFDGSRDGVRVPAVGVRFLDFPTLLIYQSGQQDVSSQSGFVDLCESREASSQRDNLKFFFHKGKSCLFKMNLDSLHKHLLNAPLYAMVLDVKDEIPKLLGSSSISLAKVTERIKLDVGKHGSPSAHGEKLLTSIYNLMGKSIGAISLAYKIVCLGAHSIPHIPDNGVCEVGVTRGKGEQHATCEMPPKVSENHPGKVLSPQITRSDDVETSEAQQPGLPAVTHPEQRVSWTEDTQEHNAFCPPPLFYSSSLKNQQERKSFTGSLAAMESVNIEDPEDENNENMHDFPAAKADRSSKLTSAPRSQHEETDSAPLGNVIRQLPLLNALLVELSQLNGQTQQPLSIHPNLAWLYTSAPGAKTECEKTINAGGKQRKIKRDVKSASGAKKNEEKRTLKYGLTKSFHLRLKLVKPGVSKRHECVESQNVKQDQPTRRTDRKRVRKSVYGDANLDETIETLVSSLETDPTPVKTPSSRSPSSKESPAKHVAEMTLDERDKKVHIPSERSDSSDPDVQSLKENRSHPHTSSSSEQEEYQDDFTSLDTSDGHSPFSSPEPNGRKTNSGSSQNKALPIPVKAENSPQRSLKGTQVIRPRLQTALSLSSDEDELPSSGSWRRRRPGSRSSGQKTPSFGKSESFDGDPGEKAMTFIQVSEDLHTNSPVLKSISSSEHSDAGEERDKLGSPGLDKNYRHISELVFNKLPGYTL